MAPITTPGKIRLAGTVDEWRQVADTLRPQVPGAAAIIDRAIHGAGDTSYLFIQFDDGMGRMILRSTGASA